MEVTGIVWAIHKVQYMIKSSKLPTMIFSDYIAIANIIKQYTLKTDSTNWSNLHLVHASIFLQQFNLKCYYKPGKEYIVLDTLSCLNTYTATPKEAELDFDLVTL